MAIKKYGTPEEIEESVKRHRENARLRAKKYADKNREKINAKARELAKTPEEQAKRRERENAYRRAHPEIVKEKNKRHRERRSPERREVLLARDKERWNNVTPEERRVRKERRTAQTRERLRTDPSFRMLFAARKNVNLGLAGIKKKKIPSSSNYQKYFGCSSEELKAHIESQFSDGMTWENHGFLWHIDHIVPLRLGRGNQDLLLKLCHFRNLQPLWKEENIRKGDTVPVVWPEGVPFTREELGLCGAV